MSKIEVNTVDVASGSTLTIGSSGKTIALASGTTNSINIKDIEWQAVVSADTTMVAGRGYFVDSSGGTKTMTLPASPSIGDTVAVLALDGQTNAVAVARNSSNIEGGTDNLSLASNYAAITLVFTDASNGWVRHNNESPDTFISATGGTATTSGNYKIHTFNSSSNFVVASLSAVSGNNTIDYLVVGGGGGAHNYNSGGAGAGGFRTSNATCMPAPLTSPLATPTGITATAQTYPITVGAGGSASSLPGTAGTAGSNSVFSTITSAGGGVAGARGQNVAGGNGGSGGGGGGECGGAAGSGNTPPVSPSQGNNGGTGQGPGPDRGSGGGGGAGAVGTNAAPHGIAGSGGIGSYTSINPAAGTTGPVGSTRYFAGGGGGGTETAPSLGPGALGSSGTGGAGGGGRAGPGNTSGPGAGVSGTANTGGGAGGATRQNCQGSPGYGVGGAGGSGVVILRYKYQ